MDYDDLHHQWSFCWIYSTLFIKIIFTYTLRNVCLIIFWVIFLTLTCNASFQTMHNKLPSTKTWTEPKLIIKQSIPYIHWYNKTITLSSIKATCIHTSFVYFNPKKMVYYTFNCTWCLWTIGRYLFIESSVFRHN